MIFQNLFYQNHQYPKQPDNILNFNRNQLLTDVLKNRQFKNFGQFQGKIWKFFRNFRDTEKIKAMRNCQRNPLQKLGHHQLIVHKIFVNENIEIKTVKKFCNLFDIYTAYIKSLDLLKIKNRNARGSRQICSKLAIKP